MINEQELAEAVDRLREGDDNGFLVSTDEVLSTMLDEGFGCDLMAVLFSGDDVSELFETKFDCVARKLLIEAYRTKLEDEAGL